EQRGDQREGGAAEQRFAPARPELRLAQQVGEGLRPPEAFQGAAARALLRHPAAHERRDAVLDVRLELAQEILLDAIAEPEVRAQPREVAGRLGGHPYPPRKEITRRGPSPCPSPRRSRSTSTGNRPGGARPCGSASRTCAPGRSAASTSGRGCSPRAPAGTGQGTACLRSPGRTRVRIVRALP